MAIAKKLGAEIVGGRKHQRAKIRVDGTLVGEFGIRRSKKVGHGHIPSQIHTTRRQALELARCNLDKADYVRILKKRGELPSDSIQ